jgi:cytochrome c556
VAATGDEKAMLAQFKKTAETCGGCHKKFRQKKES